MDVILDTNIFLKDPAFKGNHFNELFSYLKRTNSRLVIPSVVREELHERYRERLKREINDARSAWSRATDLASLEYADPAYVDIEKEAELLGERLKHPAKGVQESLFLDSDSVRVRELVGRGIKRRKPADQNGEQLRDVLLWLLVVQHARKTACEVAFLSEDLDFRAGKGSEELHPDLRAEALANKLSLSFHTAVSKFVTAHALKKAPLDGVWWSETVPVNDIEQEVKKHLPESEQIRGSLDEVVVESIEFAGGTRYTISPDAEYVEAAYTAQAVLTISKVSVPYAIGDNLPFAATLNSDIYATPISSGQYLGPVWGAPMIDNMTGWEGPIFSISTFDESAPEKYKTSVKVELSGRLEKSHLVKWEIDSLTIESASRLAS
jgi:hypothetical protein